MRDYLFCCVLCVVSTYIAVLCCASAVPCYFVHFHSNGFECSEYFVYALCVYHTRFSFVVLFYKHNNKIKFKIELKRSRLRILFEMFLLHTYTNWFSVSQLFRSVVQAVRFCCCCIILLFALCLHSRSQLHPKFQIRLSFFFSFVRLSVLCFVWMILACG